MWGRRRKTSAKRIDKPAASARHPEPKDQSSISVREAPRAATCKRPTATRRGRYAQTVHSKVPHPRHKFRNAHDCATAGRLVIDIRHHTGGSTLYAWGCSVKICTHRSPRRAEATRVPASQQPTRHPPHSQGNGSRTRTHSLAAGLISHTRSVKFPSRVDKEEKKCGATKHSRRDELKHSRAYPDF